MAPYCHVQDFANLIKIVVNSAFSKVAFEVFNAGGDSNNFTKRMLIEEIQTHVPKSEVTYSTNGGDPRNYQVDFSKVRKVLDSDQNIL